MAASTDRKPNIREAAILLRNLPSELRTRLLDKLEPKQAAVVADEMNRLEQLGEDEQEAVLLHFARANALPIADRPRKKTVPFRFLVDLPVSQLFDLIAEERPQTIALALAHLPPQKAADVLAKLPPDRQMEVVCRIAATGEVSSDVLHEVEEVFRRRLSHPTIVPSRQRGLSGVVRILNVMEPPDERRLLDALAENDPPLIREIRRAMFGADVADCAEWPLVEAAG
jgi:flagellar motor switch protein FliG